MHRLCLHNFFLSCWSGIFTASWALSHFIFPFYNSTSFLYGLYLLSSPIESYNFPLLIQSLLPWNVLFSIFPSYLCSFILFVHSTYFKVSWLVAYVVWLFYIIIFFKCHHLKLCQKQLHWIWYMEWWLTVQTTKAPTQNIGASQRLNLIMVPISKTRVSTSIEVSYFEMILHQLILLTSRHDLYPAYVCVKL